MEQRSSENAMFKEIPGVATLVRRIGVSLLAATVISTSMAVPKDSFSLVSSDTRLGPSFPNEYVLDRVGCTGGNQSPPLAWHGAPAGTKSFVITLFDRDERSTPSGWWHWVLYDLPADTTQLTIGAGAERGKRLPSDALQGRSDLGTQAYHGACPAKGDPSHRYVFTIYALNTAKLPVSPGASGAMVTSTLHEYLLGEAVLVAHYAR
jgi:Raf kinase inhibitor-like YbhB/YbcL family protein